VATQTIGPLMRDWRTRRGRSQLDLSLDVGVSTRHLSFVETGKSRPSPELVLAVAEHLDVPLRERNTMLLAASTAASRTDLLFRIFTLSSSGPCSWWWGCAVPGRRAGRARS
jgi:transcriptional regulator with XRE-family HTH domain